MSLFNKVFSRGQNGQGMIGRALGYFDKNGAAVKDAGSAAQSQAAHANDELLKMMAKAKGSPLSPDEVTRVGHLAGASGSAATSAAESTLAKGRWSFLKWGVGVPVLGTILVKSGLAEKAATGVYTTNEKSENTAGVRGRFQGFYELIKQLLEMFGIEGTKLNAWVNKRTGGPSGSDSKNPDGFMGMSKDTTETLKTGGLVAAGLGGLAALGLGAKALWSKIRPGAGATAAAAEAGSGVLAKAAGQADDAIIAVSKPGMWNSFVQKLSGSGGWGKNAAVLLTAGGAATAMLSSSPADASALTVGSATVKTSKPAANDSSLTASIKDLGSTSAGIGLGILGATTAAQSMLPIAARLGLASTMAVTAQSIPLVASIYAAGETVFNVTKDTLNGEFHKAGVHLVSGVGKTVAGIGGAATYFTLGTAWQESVRFAGKGVFGEKGTIEHSEVVQLGIGAKDLGKAMYNAFKGAAAPAPSVISQGQETTFRPREARNDALGYAPAVA